MARVTGSRLLASALQQQDVGTLFFLMGGPNLALARACADLGMRLIDVRHEQAAAMMAHAYARLLNRPGVCMAASGPATANLVTGVLNAFVDCAPVVALGGSSPVSSWGRGAFQEIDQLAMFKPITKWAERIHHTVRVPELVETAFRQARVGKPGAVYLDLPGDVLNREVEEDEVISPGVTRGRSEGRAPVDPDLVKMAVRLLAGAKRPLVLTGSGVLWSDAGEALRQFVETTGIPFCTSPQGRGVLPDDHPLSFLTSRSTAFREADCLVAIGIRFNWMVGYGQAPRFARDLKVIRVDIDPLEIGRGRQADVGIVGDAAAALGQLTAEADGKVAPGLYPEWVDRLRQVHQRKSKELESAMSTDQLPIHPLRLCKEVRDFLDRDAILVVDGNDILNFGRQSIPTFVAGHRLNSGPFGAIGVGLPFGLGAKVAKPDKQVLVLTGDGSFGFNAMELDTALRHHLAVVTVISNNAGWSADPEGGTRVGRFLGFATYDKMAAGLGCHAELVDRPEQIRPALKRAYASGLPAVINVLVDDKAIGVTQKYSDFRSLA